MATVSDNTTGTLNGLLKRVYGNEVTKLIPDNNYLTELIPFESSNLIGEKYYQPVVLAAEQGITYAAPGSGAAALQDSVAGTVSQAAVDSYQIAGQAQMSFDIAARALRAPNQTAFRKAMDQIIENLVLSVRKRLEINFLFGGTSVGTCTTGTTGTTIIISSATWAPFVWAGAAGMKIDIYSSGGVFKGTTSVTGTSISAQTLIVSTSGLAASTDLIYLSGTVGNEAIGIYQILTTSNASLFGINNTNYDLWKGNTFTVGATLTQNKLDQAFTQLVEKGFSGEAVLLVNPRVWTDLQNEQLARINLAHDGAFQKKAELGTGKIVYNTQSGNTMTVVPHTICPVGTAFLLDISSWRRIGCVDIKLGGPLPGDEPLIRLPNNLGYQILAYSHQAIFCDRPGFNSVLQTITAPF